GTPTLGSRTTNSITINWGASTDNVGVKGYNVYRDNSLVGTTTETTFTNTGLNSRTNYTYYVVAYDERNNTSIPSSTFSTSTLKIADINADGLINIYDLSILLSNYNKTSASVEWANIQVADINRD